MTDLAVRELKQADWDQWDQWLTSQPWGSPFSSAWWLEATCRAFGGRPLLLGAFRGDRLVGGVSLRIADMTFVHVVRPSMLYNPVVLGAASPRAGQEVLAALLEDIANRRLIVRPLKCTADTVDLREAVWCLWDLAASWTVVSELDTWENRQGVSRKVLQQARKAERAGIVTRVEPLDVDVLYDLVRATILRHGHETTLTKGQLRILTEAAGTNGFQTVTRDSGGNPLGAGFAMALGGSVAYDVWAGTSAKGLETDAAAQRYVFLLGELRTRGYEYFDWCDASHPGYSDFKLKFGGTLKTCLAIGHEPKWLKMLVPLHARLSKLTHHPKEQ